MENNKLTIVYQFYNMTEKSIASINSIANQIDKKFDFILFDNGSNNVKKSVIEEIIEILEKAKINFKYIIKEKNEGIPNGRNWIANKVETKFMQRLDEDDVLKNKFVLKANKMISKGYDFIILRVYRSNLFVFTKSFLRFVFNTKIIDVSSHPSKYIMKTKLAKKFLFPNQLPEDVSSVFCFANHSKKIGVLKNQIDLLYRGVSSEFDYNDPKFWKIIKKTSDYWFTNAGKINKKVKKILFFHILSIMGNKDNMEKKNCFEKLEYEKMFELPQYIIMRKHISKKYFSNKKRGSND